MGEDVETQEAVAAAQAVHAKVVIGDEKRREEKCMKEIQHLLNQFDCVLVPQATLHPGGFEFMIRTQAKPKELHEGPVDPPEEFKG